MPEPYYADGQVTLYLGGALAVLRELPAASVQTCVTSPPYWALRDYGHPDQLGNERTPEEYVAKVVTIFHEVKRVLRNDGTLWLNLGDSYAGSGGAHTLDHANPGISKSAHRNGLAGYKADAGRGQHKDVPGIKRKELVGIPWMVAFALRADGWYLRQEIIWHKPNAMPESVTDRPTRNHEQLFLMTKRPKYYYDAAAIMEPIAASSAVRIAQPTFAQQTGGEKDYGPESNRSARKTLENFAAHGEDGERNKRSVWTVATATYKGAHFAVFPPKLIEPCILAGAPAGSVVMDPFSGSGTTVFVAKTLGRQGIGIDLMAEYHDQAIERIPQMTLLV